MAKYQLVYVLSDEWECNEMSLLLPENKDKLRENDEEVVALKGEGDAFSKLQGTSSTLKVGEGYDIPKLHGTSSAIKGESKEKASIPKLDCAIVVEDDTDKTANEPHGVAKEPEKEKETSKDNLKKPYCEAIVNEPEKERETSKDLIDKYTADCHAHDKCKHKPIKHCKHVDCETLIRYDPSVLVIDDSTTFKKLYCQACRVALVHDSMAKKREEIEEKSKSDKEEDRVIATGIIFFTMPPSYEYIHLSTGIKFSSGKKQPIEAWYEHLKLQETKKTLLP